MPLIEPADPVRVSVPDALVDELPIPVVVVRALRISMAPTSWLLPVKFMLMFEVVVASPLKPNCATSVAVGIADDQLPAERHAALDAAAFQVMFTPRALVGSHTMAAILTRLVATVRKKRRTCRSMDGLPGVEFAEVFFVVPFNARPSMPVDVFARTMIPPCDRARTARHPVATIER